MGYLHKRRVAAKTLEATTMSKELGIVTVFSLVYRGATDGKSHKEPR
jgi:hypothetical protein